MLVNTNVSQSDENRILFVCYGALKTLPNHINLLGLHQLNKESQETARTRKPECVNMLFYELRVTNLFGKSLKWDTMFMFLSQDFLFALFQIVNNE